MFTSIKFAAGFVAVVAGVVSAAPNPTEPSSTSVFNVGGTCSIQWDADSTKTWKTMDIQLMSGDNLNMIPLTTVAQNIDATDATKNTFTYTCPEVTPNSAIYFYQFSSSSEPTNLLWTTRFTIADASGKTTTPTETTQPGGQSIPWGKGALVDPSTAVAPPSYLNGSGQTTAGATGSSSAAVSATSVVSSASSVVASASSAAGSASSSATSAANSMSTVRSSSSASRSASGTASGTASAASGTASSNAAVGGAVPGGVLALVGAALAVAGLV